MMKKLLALTVLILVAVGCRPKPAPAEESVASTYYHSYGFALSKEEWENRGQTGRIVSNLKGGSLETISYENGVRHGQAEWTFPYLLIVSRSCTYDHGRLVKETEHYASGAPKRQVIYLNEPAREILAWYPDGAPQAQESWSGEHLLEGKYFTHEGVLQTQVMSGSGVRAEYDGYSLSVKEQYKDGSLLLREDILPSGQLVMRTPYEEGVKQGLLERFDAQGNRVLCEQWITGRREGLSVEYANQEKVAEIPYVQGHKHGTEKRYRAGEIVETLSWVNGKKLGAHKMYMHGEVVKMEYYYHDIPVSQMAYEKMVL